MGSVPLVLEVTSAEMVLIRFHGRNVHGWLDKGENWRAVRCLYRYNNKELEEWVERLEQLKRRQRTYMYYLTIIQAEMQLIMRNSL